MFSKGKSAEAFEQELLKEAGSKPVLIDFWATWCPPCQMMKPIVEKFEHQFKDKLLVKTVNIEEEPSLAEHYKVRSIPTFVVLASNGTQLKNIGTKMGAMSEDNLISFIESSSSVKLK